MNEPIVQLNDTDSLKEKVDFLSQPSSYQDVKRVEVIETHMSWVFLTDRYAYKLKKPVMYPFLDFRTVSARRRFCMEEVRVNEPLGGDTYLAVVPLNSFRGLMQLDGKGGPVDWLVQMKRLPKERMLHTAITAGTLRNEWVQQAAEKLVDFYMASAPVRLDAEHVHGKLIKDIELDSGELLDSRVKLKNPLIVAIATDLLHFLIKHALLFDQRMADGRVIDAHGDLRPEHICLGPNPVIIDRIEFNSDLRVMDIAEELSTLALECDMLESPTTGQLFLNVYRWKTQDKIPDTLIQFYKAKRAFLRAKLSISHLLEEKYMAEETKWKSRCEAYLKAADAYCEHLPKKC
jgi:uncharacterized protein